MARFFKPLLLSLILALGSGSIPTQSYAQANSNRAVIDRMDRIERDLNNMQRQSARGSSNTNLETMGSDDADSDPEIMGSVGGDIQQQITLMQEELRNLRGVLEKNEFENRRNNETIQRLQKDVDFRLNALEQSPAAQPAPLQEPALEPEAQPQAVVEQPPVLEIKKEKIDTTPKMVVEVTEAEPAPEVIDTTTEAVTIKEEPVKKLDKSAKPTTAGDGTLNAEPKGDEDPREHYNRAFRLLNQTRYDEAGQAFEKFTKKYPDDPLIGNAYYWLGETRYIQRDYVKAADSFRQGFEVLPNGPKAPDNLLKLAMTLRALSRNDDACVVLGQIKVKFKDSSTSLLEKTEQERTRIGCK